MGTWIVIDGVRHEAVPLERLTLMQVARASKETGLSPARMEQVMLRPAITLEDEADQMMASAILVWAARVAAGGDFPTVESAQVPLARLDWVSDEEDEEEDPPTRPGPTLPGSGSGGDEGGGAPSD